MQRTKIIPLRNTEKRKKTNFIILSHIRNFSIRKDPMKPDMKTYRPYYTTNYMRRYYEIRAQHGNVPFHYHVNEIAKDWEIMCTSPLNTQSDMLTTAFENGYIDTYYKNAIVVAIQDDYDVRIPDLRTFEVIGYNILSPLLPTLRLPAFNNSVIWIDDIFNYEKYQYDLANPDNNTTYPYEYRPMRYFNKVQFNLETKRFI